MPQAHFDASVESPHLDVILDVGHPLANRVVDGFIKVGGVILLCSSLLARKPIPCQAMAILPEIFTYISIYIQCAAWLYLCGLCLIGVCMEQVGFVHGATQEAYRLVLKG
jgi:hypothetical protein